MNYLVSIKISDATTGVFLGGTRRTVITRGAHRAEALAIEKVKRLMLENWAEKHWCDKYGISHAAFHALLQDNAINPWKNFIIEVTDIQQQ